VHNYIRFGVEMLGLILLVKFEDVIFIFFLILIFDHSIREGKISTLIFLIKKNKFLKRRSDLAI